MPRSKRLTPCGLAFFNRHLAVAISNELNFATFLGKNRAFLGLAGRSLWLVVTSKSLPPVAQSPRGESLNVFGRSHKSTVTLD